ncbi:MAG TPA: CTP synthase [Candidatus Paceibacterota bacterium]
MKARRQRKYIFVVGGVMSGVGKGVASSSIGTILKARGFTVTALKIDPYINIDAGTMNPTEHGEVFVLEDGLETDQDMGNYERFLDTTLSSLNYMTTGSVYRSVIEKERNLEYKGKNVEVVPDIPLEVIRRIEHAAQHADADITITEIGGTVGEYQNILFLEAARMMKTKYPDDVAVVLVSYLPVPGSIGEMKTKPTQYAARTLNSAGVFADVIIARAPISLDDKRKEKIATFCNVRKEYVISAPDVKSIYDVPINFEKDNLGILLAKILKLKNGKKTNLGKFEQFVKKARSAKKTVHIAIAGKYFKSGEFVLSDVYISVIEALKFSAYQCNAQPVITYLNTRDFDNGGNLKTLSQFDGILVPGGFGETGIEGKIRIIEYARKNSIPYFGLCYGMQLMVVEYARNVLGLADVNTYEINPRAKHLVIDVMPDQKTKIEQKKYGGTMRLGVYPAKLKKGTLTQKAYGKNLIQERHRHRYEVNPEYIDKLEEKGLVFSGVSPDGILMEIAELPQHKHPFFLGTQFHPEFLARPLHPHPLFSAFIKAALKQRK